MLYCNKYTAIIVVHCIYTVCLKYYAIDFPIVLVKTIHRQVLQQADNGL